MPVHWCLQLPASVSLGWNLNCVTMGMVLFSKETMPITSSRQEIESSHFFSNVTHSQKLESQSHLVWGRPLRSSNPAINPTLPSPPQNNIPNCHIYEFCKYLQGW